ncbi:MAG: type IV pilin protein [Janthinobacterium lividum]
MIQRSRAAWHGRCTFVPQKVASTPNRSFLNGFTLVELAITVVIVAIIAAIALPTYQAAMKKARFADVKRDILDIQVQMERYYTQRYRFPEKLAEITTKPDPWGNPYQYLDMEGATVGEKRKDKSLHPLNTDYDLYSMGPDGETAMPLTAKASRDDIVRANNGGFIGWGADF